MEAAARTIERGVVVVADPDAGSEGRSEASEPRVAAVVARACLPSSLARAPPTAAGVFAGQGRRQGKRGGGGGSTAASMPLPSGRGGRGKAREPCRDGQAAIVPRQREWNTGGTGEGQQEGVRGVQQQPQCHQR